MIRQMKKKLSQKKNHPNIFGPFGSMERKWKEGKLRKSIDDPKSCD
jgi:hypothetical protein